MTRCKQLKNAANGPKFFFSKVFIVSLELYVIIKDHLQIRKLRVFAYFRSDYSASMGQKSKTMPRTKIILIVFIMAGFGVLKSWFEFCAIWWRWLLKNTGIRFTCHCERFCFTCGCRYLSFCLWMKSWPDPWNEMLSKMKCLLNFHHVYSWKNVCNNA